MKIFIVCTGLGSINRGFETFSRQTYEILRKEENLDVYLLKGKGDSVENEIPIKNIYRYSLGGKLFAKIFRKEGYIFEQITFAFASIPTLLNKKPDIILYSDFYLGVFYWYLRKFLGLKYKLLYSNGAPNGPPFSRCDLVQQLLPLNKREAVLFGENGDKHVVLPYAVEVNKLTLEELQTKRSIAKKNLGLTNTFCILCVAAINDSHKRISYLIDEISSLSIPNIRLFVLGQTTEESNSIIEKGKKSLGERFFASTVNPEELSTYYYASDLFVLPSLNEGLPRVILEALSFGLPVIAHDYKVTREILKGTEYLTDISKPGNLSGLIKEYLKETQKLESCLKRIHFVYENYSWDALKNQYIKMILKLESKKHIEESFIPSKVKTYPF